MLVRSVHGNSFDHLVGTCEHGRRDVEAEQFLLPDRWRRAQQPAMPVVRALVAKAHRRPAATMLYADAVVKGFAGALYGPVGRVH
jgi:hypothetical protein